MLISNRFKSPKEAEAFYNDQLPQVLQPQVGVVSSVAVSSNIASVSVQSDDMEPSALIHLFSRLPVNTHLQVLSKLFTSYLSATSSVLVPDNLLCHAAAAIVQLHQGGRTNIIYNLAKGIGTLRPDKMDSRFPIKQMPMGLVEYVAEFLLLIICKRYT